MKFNKQKITGLSGNPEVIFNEEGSDFQIFADKAGVRFSGRSSHIDNGESLQDFAKILSEAWTAHQKLLKSAVRALQAH